MRTSGLSINPIARSELSAGFIAFLPWYLRLRQSIPFDFIPAGREMVCNARAFARASRRACAEIFIRLPQGREYFFLSASSAPFAATIVLDGYHRILQCVEKKSFIRLSRSGRVETILKVTNTVIQNDVSAFSENRFHNFSYLFIHIITYI